eukprot:TRINITY_DN9656_c0_g1_i1.p1 TRINITY_DN9656_c0_g1~~TRINITY_DN9656_c0_g1_i1.p1  ORF type:complete len:1148 (+),score=183.78 TRINITY_DN9656_c0_g1_i1:343-3786(+)
MEEEDVWWGDGDCLQCSSEDDEQGTEGYEWGLEEGDDVMVQLPVDEGGVEAGKVDFGKGFTCVKPWLGTIKGAVPEGWSEETVKQTNAKPDVTLELEHVYGYRTRGTRNNGRLLCEDVMVFFAAAVGVVQELSTNEQYFYQKHTEDIVCMDIHRSRGIVATGAIGAHSSAMLCVWKVTPDEKRTEHLSCMSGLLWYAVLSCAFNEDGSLLAAVGNDDNHTVVVYDWRSASPLAQLPTPGRNIIFQISWFPSSYTCNTDAQIDPGSHFISVGVHHLYVWSLKDGALHRARGKLLPHSRDLSNTSKKISNTTAFGNESFTSVCWTNHYIGVSSTAGMLYLFTASLDKAKGVISKLVMNHAIPVCTRLRKSVAENRMVPPTAGTLAEETLAAFTSVDTVELLDELQVFVKKLVEGDEMRSSWVGEANGLREAYETGLRTLKDIKDKMGQSANTTKPKTGDKYLGEFAKTASTVLNAVEEVQAVAEEAWVDILTEKNGLSFPGDVSGIPLTVARVRATGVPEPGVEHFTRIDTFQDVKASWDSTVRQISEKVVNIIDHHKNAMMKQRSKARGMSEKERLSKKQGGSSTDDDKGVVCATSFGGRYIITGGKDGVIKFYDLYPEGAESDPTTCLKVFKPSWRIDVNGYDCTTSGESNTSFNSVRSLDVSPDQRTILVGTLAAAIHTVVFDPEKGPVHTRLETQCHYGDLRSHLRKEKPAPAGYGELWGLSPHPSKQQAITATEDKTLRVWDAGMRAMIKRKNFPIPAWSCCYNTAGDLIAVGFKNGCFGVYTARSLRRVWPPVEGSLSDSRYRAQRVQCLKFSPNDTMLAVGCFNFLDVYKIDLKTHEVAYYGSCTGISSPVKHIDWSTDSTLIQCVNKSYELLYFDLSQKRSKYSFLQLTHSRSVANEKWATQSCPLGWGLQGIWSTYMDGTDINGCSRSADEKYVAVGNDNHGIEVFQYPCVGGGFNHRGKLRYRPLKRTYFGHSSHVTSVAWSADDEHVFSTGGNDCCLLQWTVKKGTADVETESSSLQGSSSTAHPASAPPSARAPKVPTSEASFGKSGVGLDSGSSTPVGSSNLRRPHTRKWVEQQRGPVTRETAVHRSRQSSTLLRQEKFAKMKKLETDIFAARNPKHPMAKKGEKGEKSGEKNEKQ